MKKILVSALLILSSLSVNAATVYAPTKMTSWQIDLNTTDGLDLSLPVKWYVVNLFEMDANKAFVLHKNGKKVVCQFSGLTVNATEPDFYGNFPLGNLLNSGNPSNERWVDPRNSAVKQMIFNRIALAVEKNCDAVLPTHMFSALHPTITGFATAWTQADQINWSKALINVTHAYLKTYGHANLPELAAQLEPLSDFAYVQGCISQNTCGYYSLYNSHGKATLNIEIGTAAKYPGVCPYSANVTRSLSTIIKNPDLGDWVSSCAFPYPGIL